MDCANKELLAGTDLCDGRASYCHKCVEHSNVVVQAQNEILREKLEKYILQIEEYQKRAACAVAIIDGKRLKVLRMADETDAAGANSAIFRACAAAFAEMIALVRWPSEKRICLCGGAGAAGATCQSCGGIRP